jgi:hypothetical protein
VAEVKRNEVWAKGQDAYVVFGLGTSREHVTKTVVQKIGRAWVTTAQGRFSKSSGTGEDGGWLLSEEGLAEARHRLKLLRQIEWWVYRWASLPTSTLERIVELLPERKP